MIASKQHGQVSSNHLHWLVPGLVVERRHLRSHVPHRHRVVVGGVDALGLGVHAAQLANVVPQKGLRRNKSIKRNFKFT